MRRLNLVFLAILLVGTAVVGVALHLVHGVQVRRNATALLERARRAEAENRPDRAEEALKWYLSLRPDDGEAWGRYARVVDRPGADARGRERAFLLYDQALRYAPDDRAIKRRGADLAMQIGRPKDAEVLLSGLLPGTGAAGPEKAELEDLLGQCAQALARYRDAERHYERAIEADPHRVDASYRLARLRRSDLRQDAAADRAIREMVEKNPQSGRAFAYRWRYRRDLAPGADGKDVARALELSPDDREVILSALMEAEQRQDRPALRKYLERGLRVDPKDITFAVGLARLEQSEGHLDRAEALLRQAFGAKPSVDLAFDLADLLIQRGKISGEGGAGELVEKLRRAGAGDTLVRFLDGEVLYQQKNWKQAAIELERARASLTSDPALSLRINLMLADCEGRMGFAEKRLEALRRAGEGGAGGEAARLALVNELAQSGQIDQAIAILTPIAVAGDRPERRLDLVRLLLRKAARQPRERRQWAVIEGHLREAEKAPGGPAAAVASLRADLLTAEGRPDDARKLLERSLEKEPRNLGYRLSLARLAQLQGRGDEALRIIDRAEKDLGRSLPIDLARLDYWARRGGDAARVAVGRMAESRGRIPEPDRPEFLTRLGSVALRLGRPDLTRQYWGEAAALQPDNITIRLSLFDLALMTGDRDDPARLVQEIRRIDGEEGSQWRFAQASLLLDQARRGHPEGLDQAGALVAEIADRRPNWWVVPTLRGQIAELAGSTEQAITDYLQALKLGNVQPSFARRLVRLLDQQGRRADIEHVTEVLRDQGAALAEVSIVQILDAIRAKDVTGALDRARKLFPEASSNPGDHLNLGRIYLAAGRSAEGGKHLRAAVELGPGVPENWLAYVQYLAQAGQKDQAREVIRAALKALPPDRATLTAAQGCLAIGDAKGAEALLQRAMSSEGRDQDLAALRIAVDVSLRLNRPDSARAYLAKIAGAPAAGPADRAWANRTSAALLIATRRPADRQEALALVGRNLGEDPESVEDLALRAAILALEPDHRAETISILEGLARRDRLDDDRGFLLAQLYLRAGEGSKYEDQMTRLLDRKEKEPRHLTHFVNHWIDRNQLDQADRWLAELKQVDPEGLPALELEARLLDLRRRRPELLALLQARGRAVQDQMGAIANLLDRYGFAAEAEAAYRAFIARDPERPERSLALAGFLTRRDRIPEAMELLKKCWTTCPLEQVAAVALTVFDAPSAGDAERRQVEAWMAEVVQKRPESVELAARLGALWIRQGRLDQAESLYRRILASNPGHAETLNNLAWLLVMRDQPRTDEALQLIERAIKQEGPTPTLVDTRAVALIRAGRFDQAIDQLSTALPQAPRSPSLPLHLAWALKATGRPEQARREFAKAESLGLRIQSLDPFERAAVQRLREELFPG